MSGIIPMHQEGERMYRFPKSIRKSIEQAIFILHNVAFNLNVGSSAEDKTKELIFRYFENNNYSRVDPRTIVAVLLYYSSIASGEYKSQMQIATALEVDKAWVQRKRREILLDSGVETYHFSTFSYEE